MFFVFVTLAVVCVDGVTLAVVCVDGVTLAVDTLVGSLETALSSQLEELDD